MMNRLGIRYQPSSQFQALALSPKYKRASLERDFYVMKLHIQHRNGLHRSWACLELDKWYDILV